MHGLRDLIARIEEWQGYEDLRRDVDEAICSFDHTKAQISSFDHLSYLVAAFLSHLDRYLLRTSSPIEGHYEFANRRATRVMIACFGPNGPRLAFDRITKGFDRGWKGVAEEIAAHQVQELATTWLKHWIHTWVNQLTPAERLTAAHEFLNDPHVRHVLPAEAKDGSGAEVLASLPQNLLNYSQSLWRTRSAIRH